MKTNVSYAALNIKNKKEINVIRLLIIQKCRF